MAVRSCLWFLVIALCSCNTAAASAVLTIPERSEAQVAVTLDGRLNEAVWRQLPVQSDFSVTEPDTLKAPPHRTEVRMFYTDRGLYVGVWAEQPHETLVSRLSARDEWVSRDNISFTLDPSGDGVGAYWFTLALGGSVQDGTVVPERNFNNEWDGPWEGATAVVDGGWSAELFLPWSMMAMQSRSADERRMGFYISRFVAHRDERWAMPALPPTEARFLSVLRPLRLEGIRAKPQRTFYPAVSTGWDQRQRRFERTFGADVYWRPRPDLQWAATINPDFGAVEQDDLQVNLSATETFFSEKRAFFLEGQELFVTTPRATDDFANTPRLMLVNTRRIGARSDLAARLGASALAPGEFDRLSDLHGAVRMSGQRDGWRYGLMSAVEKDTRLQLQPRSPLNEHERLRARGRDFSVGRVAWDSQPGTGAQWGWGATLTSVGQDPGRASVGAVDGRMLSAGGTLRLNAQLMTSRANDATGAGVIADAVYTPRRGEQHTLSLDWFDADLDLNAMGYLARNDARYLRYRYERTRSDLERWRQRKTILRAVHGLNGEGERVASGLFAERQWTTAALNTFSLELGWRPPRRDDLNSYGNGSFRIDERVSLQLGWESDDSKPVSYGSTFKVHEEDLGQAWRSADLFLDWQPLPNLGARLELFYRKRPRWLLHRAGQRFARFEANEWRPSLEVDYFLSPRQRLSLSLQWLGLRAEAHDHWSRQSDGELQRAAAASENDRFAIANLGLQVRYHWELAPLSDLYLVYSRGGRLTETDTPGLGELFRTNFDEPLANEVVVKVRYRLGS